MQITGEEFVVSFDESSKIIAFEGVIRLHGNDYNDIVKLLQSVVDERPAMVTLDLRKLEFLNSSGINHLFKFAVKLRNQSPTELIVKGSSEIPWQQKSLKNLRTLNRKAELRWDEFTS
jgi:hypothetical protein